MITIDITMFIQIANILLLIVIMNAVLYRPIRTILTDRREKISSLQTEVENFNKNAQLRLDEFDQKMRESRAKAKGELDNARNEAKAAGTESLNKVRQEVDTEKAGQLSAIVQESTNAKQQLQGQVNEFANEMATKILGRAL